MVVLAVLCMRMRSRHLGERIEHQAAVTVMVSHVPSREQHRLKARRNDDCKGQDCPRKDKGSQAMQGSVDHGPI